MTQQQSSGTWTDKQCRDVLTKERITLGKTRSEFWTKLLGWYRKQWETAGKPDGTFWADYCLGAMCKAEEAMKLDDADISIEFAQALYQPLRVVIPQPKKSIFSKLKGEKT